jgi:hypothetical protein
VGYRCGYRPKRLITTKGTFDLRAAEREGGLVTPRKRFPAEEIITKLREAEVLLSKGQRVGEVCRQLDVSESTYFRIPEKFDIVRGTHDVFAEYGNAGRFDYITGEWFGWMNVSCQVGLSMLPVEYLEKLEMLTAPDSVFKRRWIHVRSDRAHPAGLGHAPSGLADGKKRVIQST